MSFNLYNQLFKENPDADKLLAILELSREDFGRYRDIWLSDTGDYIIVYTRLGGGSRPYFKEVFEVMGNHPLAVDDFEDRKDHTYVYFKFQVPDSYRSVCRHMAIKQGHPKTVSEKFQAAKKEMDEMPPDQLAADPRFAPYCKAVDAAVSSGDTVIRLYDDDMPQELRK